MYTWYKYVTYNYKYTYYLNNRKNTDKFIYINTKLDKYLDGNLFILDIAKHNKF